MSIIYIYDFFYLYIYIYIYPIISPLLYICNYIYIHILYIIIFPGPSTTSQLPAVYHPSSWLHSSTGGGWPSNYQTINPSTHQPINPSSSSSYVNCPFLRHKTRRNSSARAATRQSKNEGNDRFRDHSSGNLPCLNPCFMVVYRSSPGIHQFFSNWKCSGNIGASQR